MNNLDISAHYFFFEVTRRCNMSCDFCVRGNAECLDISPQIVDAALENVTHISSLIISGGEPCLNIPMIKYIFNKVKEKNICCGSFYMVTNGLIYSEELIIALIDFYSYCVDECGGEADICGLSISLDEFHNTIPSANYTKYQALSFYDHSKEGNFYGFNSGRKILNVGKAYENGLGQTSSYFLDEDSGKLNIEDFGDKFIEVDLVYINARGDVLADCDLSYVLQDKYKQGNVLNNTLANIMVDSSDKLRQYFLKSA